ncbi:MAG TPA: energy transducer TonB [Terriglobales bacterium]|nr:energy transducer TonB [Terriglobales bacterium]
MPAGTQRYQRTKMVLPLRVWVNEPSSEAPSLAHTLDISPIGGRLGGLRAPMHPGQTITLQRGQRKAQFRVVWSRQLAPAEIQAGIEALEGGRNIWDVELPQQARPQAARPQAVGPQEVRPQVVRSQPAPVEFVEGPPVLNEDDPSGQDPYVPAPTGPSDHRAHSPASHSRMRWIAASGMLLFLCLLALLIRYEVLASAPVEQPQIAVPGVPTPAQLAAMTPKPVRLVPLATTDTESAQRVQVAEAPKGRPEYPVAPQGDTRGKVNLKVVIATDGRVKQVLLVSGQQQLARAAEQAVRSWHYKEHERNGTPVEAETSVTVSFLGQDAVSLRFPSSNRIVAN